MTVLMAADRAHVAVTIAIVVISWGIGIAVAVWFARRFQGHLYTRRPGLSRWESIRQNFEDQAENPPASYRYLYPALAIGFTTYAVIRRGWPMGVLAAIVFIPWFTAQALRPGPTTRWYRAHPKTGAVFTAPVEFVLVASLFPSLSLWWCAFAAVAIAILSGVVAVRRGPRPNAIGGN